MLVLQSLALYLFFTSENAQSTWILTGIALSIAQTMDLHSEPRTTETNVLERELRRRVWWTLCQIDVRVSGNCNLEPHVPHNASTPLPLHINDSDLTPSSTSPPSPRTTFTDTTLALVKHEVTRTTLAFQRTPLTSRSLRESIIHTQLTRYTQHYLPLFQPSSTSDGPTSGLLRLCHLGVRFIQTRLWKMLYDAYPSSPLTQYDNSTNTREALIAYNTDVLEIAHQLPCKYKQYGWFFRCKYTQWHALAYLLIQMCRYTQGRAVERAWEVLDTVFGQWEEKGIASRVESGEKVSKLWKPLLELLGRAREARARGLEVQIPTAFETMPSTLGVESQGDDMEAQENAQQQEVAEDAVYQAGLMGDPFLGSTDDLNMEMNWETLDQWAKMFEGGYLQEQEAARNEFDMAAESFHWW